MTDPAPVESVQVLEFRGLPVRFNPDMLDYDANGCPYHGLAFARGLWPFKRIEVGRGWFSLPSGEQNAALAHEAGHCFHLHLEKRLLAAVVCWMPAVQHWARQQEFDADAFAVREGYGDGLVSLVSRYEKFSGNALMPSGKDRLDNILRTMQEPK